MPLIPIVAWFKKWITSVVPVTYAEWADTINVTLMPNNGLTVLFCNPTPTVSLLQRSNLDVTLVKGNNISVKLMPSNPIDVVVDN